MEIIGWRYLRVTGATEEKFSEAGSNRKFYSNFFTWFQTDFTSWHGTWKFISWHLGCRTFYEFFNGKSFLKRHFEIRRNTVIFCRLFWNCDVFCRLKLYSGNKNIQRRLKLFQTPIPWFGCLTSLLLRQRKSLSKSKTLTFLNQLTRHCRS